MQLAVHNRKEYEIVLTQAQETLIKELGQGFFRKIGRLYDTYYPKSGAKIIDNLLTLSDNLDSLLSVDINKHDSASLELQLKLSIHLILSNGTFILDHSKEYEDSPHNRFRCIPYYHDFIFGSSFERKDLMQADNFNLPVKQDAAGKKPEFMITYLIAGYNVLNTNVASGKQISLENDMKSILSKRIMLRDMPDYSLDSLKLKEFNSRGYEALAEYNGRKFLIPFGFGEKATEENEKPELGLSMLYAMAIFSPGIIDHPQQKGLLYKIF